MKESDERKVQNKLAYKFSIRCDQAYQEFDKNLSTIGLLTYQLLTAARAIERNKVDLIKGETTQKSPTTGILLSLRDLEIENQMYDTQVSDNVLTMWNLMGNLYKFVGAHRLDGVVFMSDEEYTEKATRLIDNLKKNGIEMFRERKIAELKHG